MCRIFLLFLHFWQFWLSLHCFLQLILTIAYLKIDVRELVFDCVEGLFVYFDWLFQVCNCFLNGILILSFWVWLNRSKLSKLFLRYLIFSIALFDGWFCIFLFVILFFFYLRNNFRFLLLLINFIDSLNWVLLLRILLLKFHIVHIILLFDLEWFLPLMLTFYGMDWAPFRLGSDCRLLF